MAATLERWALRLARFFSPSLNRLFVTGGGATAALATLAEAETLIDLHQSRDGEWKRELREAAAMYTGYQINPVMITEARGREAYEGLPRQLKERFWELELALEDRGWRRQLALSQYEFSRYGIQQIMLIARLYAVKNPLIRRGIKISSFYVFGRGVDITSEDEATHKVLTEFIEANKSELGHNGLVEKDQTLRTDGNLFFAFFSTLKDGQTTVRTIDAVEMQEVISDPDDAATPWYYLRTWEQRTFDPALGQVSMTPMNAWYPAVGFEPEGAMPDMMRGYKVMRDTPVYHVKTGGLPKWQFGCPEVYNEIDWARAYKKLLENHCTVLESMARFAWNMETKGGSQAIKNFSDVLSTTLANGGTQIETNPPNVVASTFVTGPGNKLTPIKTAGMTPRPEDSRRVLLMLCAGSGLPETFYGDASTGSLATAQSLDRPTELQFLQRQELWREVIQTVCGYALNRSAMAPAGTLREAKRPPRNADIKVNFPAILEHDITARVGAIVNAMTLNGFECIGIDEKVAVGMLLQELGYEDWQELIDEMYPEDGKDGYDPDRTVEDEPPPVPGMPGGITAPAPVASQNPAQQQGVEPHPPAPRKPHPKRDVPTKETLRLIALLQHDRKLLEKVRVA